MFKVLKIVRMFNRLRRLFGHAEASRWSNLPPCQRCGGELVEVAGALTCTRCGHTF